MKLDKSPNDEANDILLDIAVYSKDCVESLDHALRLYRTCGYTPEKFIPYT